ncbi:MAG: peptide chain release factor N(5)-glutamine methyltransferase, partial [Clostridiales bacterium]|nr:peptide chain release factor N(5)-glutamine methyltransferase [Clostridiales bacterium]
CCNPPYIPSGELAGLQAEVRREPMLALDGGDDGLDFYRRLIKQAPRHLKGQGHLLLEKGDGQSARLAWMLTADFSDIMIYDDLAGLERLLAARWKDKHGLT